MLMDWPRILSLALELRDEASLELMVEKMFEILTIQE